MPIFNVILSMDSEAFAINPALETSRILRRLALQVERDEFVLGDEQRWLLLDYNGNHVGTASADRRTMAPKKPYAKKRASQS